MIVGDWHHELPPRAPFDLLLLDGGGFEQAPDREGPLAVELLGPGGMLVIDDLAPERAEHDPARAFLLGHPGLAATELLTTPQAAAIVATVLPR